MKYEVTFAMCHCETVIVELEPEDIDEDTSEDEICALVEEKGRKLATSESGFEVDEMIELYEIE